MNIFKKVIQKIVLIILDGESVLKNNKDMMPSKMANRAIKSIGIDLIVK